MSLGAAAGPTVATDRWFHRLDFWFISFAVLLIVAGLLSQFSVAHGRNEFGLFLRQTIFVFVGAIPLVLFFLVNPENLRKYSGWLYGINVTMLGLVLLLGSTRGGAQRWIEIGVFQFQPSELAKLLVIITLAAFFANRQESINRFSTFALSLLHVLVPVVLVYRQPHLGASLVLLAIWFGISVVARVPWKYLIGFLLVVVVGATAAWSIPGVLREYQRERVVAMFADDRLDSQWHAERAQIAFGAGGLMGAGFLKGEQKAGGFVPEQHNDFIFTVIGEEGGLIGTATIILLFCGLLYRIWYQTICADDNFQQLLLAGIFSLLAFQTFVNIGMNLSLLPVVGLWLPFISYGGSAMFLCMACIGLVLNIGVRSQPSLFS